LSIINLNLFTDILGGIGEVEARFSATPKRAKNPAIRISDDTVIFPSTVISDYQNGTWSQIPELTVLPLDCYWAITVRDNLSGRSVQRNVLISTDDSVDFEDLVDVDPGSGEPSEEALSAWTIVLADIELIGAAVEADRISTLGYLNDTIAAALEIENSKVAAASSASNALISKQNAETSASTAVSASEVAEAARSGMLVSGAVSGNDLVLYNLDGDEVFRGNVRGIQGIQGPVGPAGLTWRGNWSSSIDYINNNAVYYDGSSWFASGDPTIGEIPAEASAHWVPLAIRGPVGIQGPTGNTGIQGLPGDLTTSVSTSWGGTITILPSYTLPSTIRVLLTANVIFAALANQASDRSGTITLILKQPSTGGPYTVAFPSALEWAGDANAPSMPTAPNSELIVHLFWTGSAWRAMVGGVFFP